MILALKNKYLMTHFKNNGFTLVETLVAITILLTTVVAPMVFLSANISSIFSIKDKITALYLAEDAIDFVKYKIATEFNLVNPSWLDGVAVCVLGGGGQPCLVDSFSDTVEVCSGSCPVMNYNASTGVYGYGTSGSWAPSKFTRTVTIASVANDPYPSAGTPQEVIITALVSWDYKGVPKKVIIFEHAFSWGI